MILELKHLTNDENDFVYRVTSHTEGYDVILSFAEVVKFEKLALALDEARAENKRLREQLETKEKPNA